VLLTVIFVFLTALVLRADLRPTEWDIYFTREIQQLPHIPIGLVLEWVSGPGFWPWYGILVVSLVGSMLALRRLTEAVFIALASLGGLVAELVKNLVDRPRPTPDFARITIQSHTFSFPSGHVTSYVTLFGFLFYLAYTLIPRKHPLRRPALIICALFIILVGPSRISMGAHWASDVLAGYALGFAYLLVIIELYRAWQKRHPKA
jgi:undecaprenyl-diphosphatase